MAKRYRPGRRTGIAALSLAVLLGAGCAALVTQERELTFRPVREVSGWFSGLPSDVREFYLPVSDAPGAERLFTWYWPSDNPSAPTLLYLHGVRWNLTAHLRRIENLRSFGFSVVAIDYRGFGKSDGDLPSEQTVYEDARAGWRWLVAHERDPARRFIYGHSLGGAVAIDLAASFAGKPAQARGLIVESSFTSLADIAADLTFSWIPTSILLTQKFDSVDKIKSVDIPVLIVHGKGDRYVSPHFSESLFEAARMPKKLLLVENGSHNNSMWLGDSAYQQALGELFGLSGAPEGDAHVNGRAQAH